ncbi:energy transducer TonB [Dyella amyloliquefaciens]|uniref:energy transducer TonB n=1 Tax=Dyella amyloliquefaciens TaxID=1770545 RepID=UPI00102E8B8E|nr:energy transducer TonB [Dyella amyloliquefaciens]
MNRVFAVWISGWLLACVANVAAADGAATATDVRNTVEGSMLVTGTIEVNPDGSLHDYTLDRPEKLPPVVVDVVSKTVSSWTFKLSEPINEVVKTEVSLRVVAKPVGDGKFRVVAEGASFGKPGNRNDQPSYKDRSFIPRFPRVVLNARVTGTVYVLTRIGRDGTVQEAIAEQVNLDQFGREADMNRYRKQLADSSIFAARHWTFNPPTKGADVDNPYWVVRIPVSFYYAEQGVPPAKQYGQWEAYIPGPRQTPSWIGKALANEAPDAMPGDGLRSGDPRLQLVTPVGGA